VVAVDVSAAALDIARKKLSGYRNVSFVLSDAYDLGDSTESCDMLFSTDWWSHIPKGMVDCFMKSACGNVVRKSRAVFIDMSMNDYFENEPHFFDGEGNRISLRKLPDGSEYRVVKNFPTEAEIRQAISPYAQGIRHHKFADLQRWMAVFETR
jgi:demethylmenaquinone methyltransferase/2-methoxy-6-polyprenyl-1,4-benzoquinol methylase